eukprot:964694-Rhodomonas_salina.1
MHLRLSPPSPSDTHPVPPASLAPDVGFGTRSGRGSTPIRLSARNAMSGAEAAHRAMPIYRPLRKVRY